MNPIYFDHACTSFPKPSSVPKAMYEYMTQLGCNINRGCYQNAYQTEELVYETRELLCSFFGGQDSRLTVFTKNVTESLNVLLKGFLKPGDHVITSSMEHNAVMRPLVQLEKAGIAFSRVPCRVDGSLNPEDLEAFVTPKTKAVVMTHASNVCGTLLPIAQIGAFCRSHGLRLIVDTAQTAGVWPIHMEQMQIDAIAFTGHKGLMGPQGIGGFLLTSQMVPLIDPFISGGTGSISHTEEIPSFMPDRFEAGTMNLPGIIGLRAGLLWLKETGLSSIRTHELALTSHFLQGLQKLEEENLLRIVGKKDMCQRTSVVSIQTEKQDLSEIAVRLEEYGIMTRVGLHCAPSAHKTLKTYPTGTIRFSFGWQNQLEDIDYGLKALSNLLR